MARKSNKTSHVLNLLTKGNPASEKENTAKVTIVDESVNDALSENILEKLEAELSEPEKKTEKEPAIEELVAAEKEPAIEESVAAEKESAIEEPVAAEKELVAEKPVLTEEDSVAEKTAQPGRETVAEETVTAAKQEPTVIEEPVAKEEPVPVVSVKEETEIKEKSLKFFNIMEELLERQDIEKYTEQYGVCRCPKCLADIKARTLTNLPAKYVSSEGVFGAAAMNFYENKYKIRILTELIRSCIAVRNNPRHDNN